MQALVNFCFSLFLHYFCLLYALFLNIKYLFSYVFLRFLYYLYIAFMHNNTTYSHILSFYSHGTA